MDQFVWQSFTWFDVAIVGVILLSILISIFRGFLREAISLATWVVAILAALKFAAPVGRYFESFISVEIVRYILAFIIIFFVIVILGIIVNVFVGMFVKKTGLSLLDRIVGSAFGVARGILVIGVVLMFLHVSPYQDAKWLTASKLAPCFQGLVTWLESFLPEKKPEMANFKVSQ